MSKFVLLNNKIKDFWSLFSWEIGVDLGSSNTLINLKDRGVIVDEPTMIARLRKKRWTGLSAPRVKKTGPIAFGFKAKEMLNREPKQIEVVSPIKNGVISDFERFIKIAFSTFWDRFEHLRRWQYLRHFYSA